jgi:hypothetical protein
VAKIVNPDINIIVKNNNSVNNYTGNSIKIENMNLDLLELELSILDYKTKI